MLKYEPVITIHVSGALT